MRKIIILLSCISLVLIFAVLAIASPEGELGKWWKQSEVVRAIDLSNTQIDQIEQVYLQHREELADLMKTLKTLEGLLKSAMEVEPVEETGILQHAESVAEARKNLEMARTRMMLSIRKQLTPEQWTKLEGMQILSGTLVVTANNMDLSNAVGDEKVFDLSNSKIQKPVAIYNPIPPYTGEAREANAEGLVILQAIIWKDGSVDSFKVLQGVGYGLDESAIRTISKEWKFTPGMLNGKPVNTRVNIEVSFRRY
jgi:TonB family protein